MKENDRPMHPIPGIHHITAIAGNPQRNLDFYTGVLGLRLVKQTVNFDDPGTYHFYFASADGAPGTILTFFPWVNARAGKLGSGQAAVVSFSIPEGSMGYWHERLDEIGASETFLETRFGEEVLNFRDPDGLPLALVSQAGEVVPEWEQAPVPREYAIRGFHSLSLWEEGFQQTAELLNGTMGFKLIQEGGGRFRFQAPGANQGSLVDVFIQPNSQPGRMGAGIVHHVAWRTQDDESQLDWRRRLVDLSFNVTPVMDRQYFHSIYFREPGGVLFEIATDPPGFTLDEPLENLGAQLKLPPWLETRRGAIERSLPAIQIPSHQRISEQ
jgi:glyoxalase family protein